jgi:hypothetical protein
MVSWGVVEFTLHTLRPDTIQREDRIVSVFKNTTEIIWDTHKRLQINASEIANRLKSSSTADYSAHISIINDDIYDSKTDWLLVRDGQAQWWSQNLTLDVVQAMLDATSVLRSSKNGVFVIASSDWTHGDSNWRLLGSTRIFSMSLSDSRYGDVYEPSIPALSGIEPDPFYLEGSPDLLPFDHRFSILRINNDYTTGHLAISTLDPGVRNYFHPVWMYGFRTIFFLIVILLSWGIINLIQTDSNAKIKLGGKLLFIAVVGWITVLLDIVRFWGGVTTAESLFAESGISLKLIYYAWISFIAGLMLKFLIQFFNKERFFDHGTRFNKTSLYLFITGCVIGGISWWVMSYYNLLFNSIWAHNPISQFTEYRQFFVSFFWFVFIAASFKLLEALLIFIQKSVKYQVNWILQILITGHIYLYTILFILNYDTINTEYFTKAWVFTTLPIGIWILQNMIARNTESTGDTIFVESLKLSLFPTLVVVPLYVFETIGSIEIAGFPRVVTGLWLTSFLSSVVIVYVLNLRTSENLEFIHLNFKSLLSRHSEIRFLITSVLIVLIYFVSSPIAEMVVKRDLEKSYTSFLINQSNHHPVEGSYKPALLGLPVYQSWLISGNTYFEEILDYSISKSVESNVSSNALKWDKTPKNEQVLKIYRATGSFDNPENYQILATTVDSYTRIFGRLEAIISSISILAVLSIHFGLGIVGSRSTTKNASTI